MIETIFCKVKLKATRTHIENATENTRPVQNKHLQHERVPRRVDVPGSRASCEPEVVNLSDMEVVKKGIITAFAGFYAAKLRAAAALFMHGKD